MKLNHQRVENWVPLLPGYVFVYAEEEPVAYRSLLGLENVHRVLTYGSAENTALYGRDLAFADWLWGLGGRIGIMKALQEGDRVEIIDGVFQKLQGTITRMDRRRQTVLVTLDTLGAIRHLWLAYEIIAKL